MHENMNENMNKTTRPSISVGSAPAYAGARGEYYIVKECNGESVYLHKDGIFRHSCLNPAYKVDDLWKDAMDPEQVNFDFWSTAYWQTKEEAEKFLAEWRKVPPQEKTPE